MLLWLVAMIGVVAGLVAVFSARRLRRRLDALSQSYWELRYEYTRLRADLARLDPERPEEPAPPDPRAVAFVPIASLKTKE